MNRFKQLNVFFNEKKAGTLALTQKNTVAFEYDGEWLQNGFSISPLSLPLQKKVFLPEYEPFEGLFGVFADSLPDGWGRLLVDRFLLSRGFTPDKVNSVNRLAIVNSNGMGALSYKPSYEFAEGCECEDLDKTASECKKILETDMCDDLDKMFLLGGSSGGARPKIFTSIDNEDWIIKFPASTDKKNIGYEEYMYSLCAVKCGIEMSETRLFDSKKCKGYFGTKRFDRVNGRKVHTVSVSGLLETSHRIPNIDYNTLMKLTLKITNDYGELEKLFRLMCFNVFAHNRDDHSKNFSFLYNEEQKKWMLSPAYDLTFSNSFGGEHATTVNGNGANPGMKDILEVAAKAGLDTAGSRITAEFIRDTVNEMLLPLKCTGKSK